MLQDGRGDKGIAIKGETIGVSQTEKSPPPLPQIRVLGLIGAREDTRRVVQNSINSTS